MVIGSDDDIIEFGALLATFPYVLYKWFPSDGVEGFTGEASGTPASWDNAESEKFSR